MRRRLPRKPQKLRIKYHTCKPTPMLPNQAYPYCGICGRVMSKAQKVYFPTHMGEDGRLKVTVGYQKPPEPNSN